MGSWGLQAPLHWLARSPGRPQHTRLSVCACGREPVPPSAPPVTRDCCVSWTKGRPPAPPVCPLSASPPCHIRTGPSRPPVHRARGPASGLGPGGSGPRWAAVHTSVLPSPLLQAWPRDQTLLVLLTPPRWAGASHGGLQPFPQKPGQRELWGRLPASGRGRG